MHRHLEPRPVALYSTRDTPTWSTLMPVKKAPVRTHVRRPAAQNAKLLTVSQSADLTGLSEVTLRHWIAQRRIDVVRMGRAIRIPRASLENTIERGLVPADKRVAVA